MLESRVCDACPLHADGFQLRQLCERRHARIRNTTGLEVKRFELLHADDIF
jgi:hypothetical protein